jgi:hypothetical protein
MVRTTWRWATSATTSSHGHSAQSNCFFFSQDGQKLRPQQEKATRTRRRQEPHQSRAKPCSSRPQRRNSPQPLDRRPQRAVAPGEALRPDPQQLLEVALDEPVERRLARTPRLVDPATHLHSRTRAGGRGAGGKGGGPWRSDLPTTEGVWSRHWPSKVREPATPRPGCEAGARLPRGRRTADPP